MWKMMVVDDEPLVKVALRSMVDWGQLGISIAGDAGNGQEAMEIWEGIRPDIILTDIKMPVMDGIEFIRQVKKLDEHALIIVLSCYDDFDLVREAFQLGAFDYILKPEMDEDKLKDLFARARQHMDRQNRRHQEHLKLQDILYENRRDIIEAFYKKLIWGQDWTEDWVEKRARELGLRIGQENIVLCLVDVRDNCTIKSGDKGRGNHSLNSSIITLIESVLDEFRLGDVFTNSHGQYVVVFSLKDENSKGNQRNVLLNITNVISNRLEQYMNLKASIGISTLKQRGYGDLYELLRESEKALEQVFFVGRGRTIFYEDLLVNREGWRINRHEALKQFQDLLETDAWQDELDNILIEGGGGMGLTDVDEIRRLYEGYAGILLRYIEQRGLKEDVQGELEDYFQNLQEDGTLAELNEWIRSIWSRVAQNKREPNYLVQAAKQYIRTNYHQPISLADAAQFLHISEEHLCRVFSENQETSFMRYLMEIRVEKAKELLAKGDLKVYEVASRVGYTSVEYFSKMFKKMTGKTPRQFFDFR